MSWIVFAQDAAFDITPIAKYVGIFIYGVLALIALWGAYSVVMVWRRIGQLRFRGESEQNAFLEEVNELVESNQIEEIGEMCEEDPRALPQLTLLAAENRELPSVRLRELLIERFQRDVLAELDYRTSWVATIIKAAPMVGLLGTVIGMMGAFSKLSAANEVSPDKLASDIMLALITTACGLAIAIPLVLATAGINVRIGRLEDFIGSGMTRILSIFKQ
jgi:biopolymer transport protein ExbB/TolQ